MEPDRRSRVLTLLLLVAVGSPAYSQYGRPVRGGRGRTPSTAGATVGNEPLATFTGAVQNIDKKRLTLQEGDSKSVEFVCSRKTRYYDGDKKIKSSDIKPGDQVTVETKRFADGELEAINVHIEHPKAPKAS